MKNTITLYVDSLNISPYAMSVFVSLVEKKLDFNLIPVDLNKAEHLRTDYSQQSLTSRIPTLQHDNFHLSESSAISEYLEDIFPPPQFPSLYPQDKVMKARARQIQAWIRSDLIHLREERPTSVIFLSPSSKPLSIKAKETADKLIKAADLLIKDGSVNLFDEWCIADLDLALMLNRLIKNNEEVPLKLVKYANHQWERDSVKKWLELPR